ncbi:hypothetical protein B0H11DRAFT_128529 [Mycena galericulata]|nr:hypothetical protein B0H11DRAFT_128529 [Mycena galericulata]
MSIWSTTRRNATRAFSSAANVVREPHSVNLSPEKMRALIAMYHQAETFVTRENLETKIDEAFTQHINDLAIDRTSLSLRDFEDLLSRREEAPTVSEWNAGPATFRPMATLEGGSEKGGGKMSMWSHLGVSRDSKVIEALYGVETLGSGVALPGLDALEDNPELLEKSAREDRERYEDSDYLNSRRHFVCASCRTLSEEWRTVRAAHNQNSPQTQHLSCSWANCA